MMQQDLPLAGRSCH